MSQATTTQDRVRKVTSYLEQVILGKSEVIEQVLIALLSRGHMLIEDVPGVGKTTLARSLANLLECQFQRISFTSDMMPSDILGVTIYDRNTSEFVFKKGPIFTNILLADELNRTTPKTQSAFMEAMESGQVTIERETFLLPDPFLVMATQNPLEFSGTFPLPISQLDRFLMRITMGYPGQDFEEKMLVQYRQSKDIPPPDETLHISEVLQWQKKVVEVRVDATLVGYLATLAKQTREHPEIHLGVSPRATLGLQRAAQARAFIHGKDYVIPDDIQTLAGSVWAHRILLRNQVGIGTDAQHHAEQLIQQIILDTPVPI